MRRPRALVYESNDYVACLLKEFLALRGYEAYVYGKPVICPLESHNTTCAAIPACADIVLADFMMPLVNGVELLCAQTRRGCRVPNYNKAIMSGDVFQVDLKRIRRLGYAFFEKPFRLAEMSSWLEERENLMDLTRPLGVIRAQRRYASREEIIYLAPPEKERRKGLCLNMSTSGLCMRTGACISEKQLITIYQGGPKAARTAVVRWIKMEQDGLCTAGLFVV